MSVLKDENRAKGSQEIEDNHNPLKIKFKVFGEEMIEKGVKQNGRSGMLYLPPAWVGKNVKIIRMH